MKRLVLVFLLFLIGLVGGCSKQTPPKDELAEMIESVKKIEDQRKSLGTNLVSKSGIYKALRSVGITNLLSSHFSHFSYEYVKFEDIDDIGFDLRSFLFEKNVFVYDAGRFNCEDYSRATTLISRIFHKNDKTALSGASYAVGIIYYKPENILYNDEFHAMNVFVLKDNVVFFEPQKQEIRQLSEKERNSVYWFEF
jgi:hypothetical protein